MNWDEFADLLNGLNEDTPLVKLVQIRTETDPETIKNYNSGQRKIRSDWQKHLAKQKTTKETNDFLNTIEDAFRNYTKGD